MKKRSNQRKQSLCGEIFLFLLSALFLGVFFVIEYGTNLFSPPVGAIQVWKCVLVLAICITAYCGGLLLKNRTRRNPFRFLFLLFLFLYLYLIVSLTLLDKGLRLDESRFLSDNMTPREYYLRWFVNFHPFESIYTVYIKGLMGGYVSLRYVVLNLVGNLCVFMPLSVLLPALFRCARKWYCFFPIVVFLVAAVECLQFWLMVGSCDVDDVILNVGGAMILYLFILIPPIKRRMELFWNGGK